MIKATGIVRRVDNLGRVVLPKGLRRILGLRGDGFIEFFTDGETIILKKYDDSETVVQEKHET